MPEDKDFPYTWGVGWGGSVGKPCGWTHRERLLVLSLTAHTADGAYSVHFVSKAAAPGCGTPLLRPRFVSP